MKTIHVVAAGVAVAISGCATASTEDREALLGKPIDCAVAEQDIADLEAAMPSRRERAGSAVRSVTPVGAVAGVATGTYRDRAAVLTGHTADELNARIEEIAHASATAAPAAAED